MTTEPVHGHACPPLRETAVFISLWVSGHFCCFIHIWGRFKKTCKWPCDIVAVWITCTHAHDVHNIVHNVSQITAPSVSCWKFHAVHSTFVPVPKHPPKGNAWAWSLKFKHEAPPKRFWPLSCVKVCFSHNPQGCFSIFGWSHPWMHCATPSVTHVCLHHHHLLLLHVRKLTIPRVAKLAPYWEQGIDECGCWGSATLASTLEISWRIPVTDRSNVKPALVCTFS